MEREKLEELIREELMKEGWWDRLKAKSTGSIKALSQVGKNISAAAKGDPEAFKNVAFTRSSEIAQSRVRGFANKLNKIGISFINDMESLFGDGMERAPDPIRAKIEEMEEGFDMFVADLNDLYEQLGSIQFKKKRGKRR